MCGICGVIGETRGELAESRARSMLASMVHRGPDDEGLLAKPGAMLGMRRLSIIDLGGGHQPIFNEDGSVGVVFNGEIYNFPHVRASLESRGHHFRTNSDTEVIVHAYEEWGERCLTHLRGMFAFALWDGRSSSTQGESRVLLARDRLGIKPLYYRVTTDEVIWGSEIKVVRAYPGSGAEFDRSALPEYLAFGYLSGEQTFYRGIRKLMPGHWMEIDRSGQVNIQQYWDLAVTKSERPQSQAEYIHTYREML